LPKQILTLDRQLQTAANEPGQTHAQPREVRTSVSIAGHNLTVEHDCLGRHLAKQRRD